MAEKTNKVDNCKLLRDSSKGKNNDYALRQQQAKEELQKTRDRLFGNKKDS